MTGPGDGMWFGELLREARLAAGMTQEDLSARSGLSVRAISDMERDRKRKPYFRSVGLLVDALDVPQPVRAALHEAARRARQDGVRRGRMAAAPAEERRLRETRDEAPAGYGAEDTIAGHDLAAMAAESQGFGEWVATSHVADATIEYYAVQVRALARDFEYEAIIPLLTEVRRLRNTVATQLRGHLRLSQAADLYLIAAQVYGLLAWMTGDLGNYRAADVHAWTAWVCAEQAGQDGARAWVRVTQAKLAYWGGRYRDSAWLAQDGLEYRCADSARVFLALFRARALARDGQHSGAMKALGQATAEREHVAAPDLLGGVWGFAPARYHGLVAEAHLLLDKPGQAVTEAEQAITLSQAAPAAERHLYAEMLFRTDQAHAHLRQPDLDGAAAALRPVLILEPGRCTEPICQQLSRLRHHLAGPHFAGSPQAQDLRNEIEAFGRRATLCRIHIASLPGGP